MTFDFILVPNCIDYESYKHPCAGFEGVWVGGPGPPFPHLVNQFGEIHTLEVSNIDKKGNESTDVRNYWSSLNIIGCYIFRERPPPFPTASKSIPHQTPPSSFRKKSGSAHYIISIVMKIIFFVLPTFIKAHM